MGSDGPSLGCSWRYREGGENEGITMIYSHIEAEDYEVLDVHRMEWKCSLANTNGT